MASEVLYKLLNKINKYIITYIGIVTQFNQHILRDWFAIKINVIFLSANNKFVILA